jgi:Translationally controlled tumour protein
VLEGANPSAEGEDADEGGESGSKQILDIEDQFRLNKIEGGMDKKAFTSDLKGSSNHSPRERPC